MSVPLYDHARLYRAHRGEIDAAIARVLESGRLDWGEEVPDSLEEILANATGLLLEPAAAGRDDEGWLGEGVVDEGELHLDDLQIVP